MGLDSKQVTITVSQDPKTSDLTITGDGVTRLSGNGVVVYELVDQTNLGLQWSGMSFRVNEPWYKNEYLSATITDPMHIEVHCEPDQGQPAPEWGVYAFYLSFMGTKEAVDGKSWSFDPVVDCEEPE